MDKPAEHRTHVLAPIRCTKTEQEAIRVRATEANLTQSAYLRHVALTSTVIKQPSPYTHEFIEQLRRIGVNLNQMTRELHTRGIQVPELNNTLHRLNSLMDEAIESRSKEL